MKRIIFLIPPNLEDEKMPPPERIFGCSYGLYPNPNIFILYCAAIAEEAGYKVHVEDMPLSGVKAGLFVERIKALGNAIYCFNTVNLSKNTDLIAFSMIREIHQNVPVIYFGPAPTINPDEFLADDNCYVIRGEPEVTFEKLLSSFSSKESSGEITGLSFKKEGKILHNDSRPPLKDIDSLPFPARHLVNRDKFYSPKLPRKPYTIMVTSRGCAFKCVYCVPNSQSFAREIDFKRKGSHKPPVGIRSPQNIIDEFIQLDREGYKSVAIIDDQFVWGKKRTLDICSKLIGLNLDIEWGCLARADNIDDEIVSAMAKAKCRCIDIGVESFSQEILDWVKKDVLVDKLVHGINLVKKYGIQAKINVIFGASPLETKDTIRHTLDVIKKIEPDAAMFSILNPFPGTEMYNIAKKNGWFVHGDYVPVDVAKKAIIQYPHLPANELEVLIRKANRQFYLNPKYILRKMRKFDNVGSAINALKVIYKKLTI
jgi:anaerobic magnesium-protoporphyrin IX monomethyl ester cyclase